MGWFDNLISGGQATSFSANENVATAISGSDASAGSFSEMLKDPNFQSFLAGTGAALDPNGVGGNMGKAVQGMIQSKQMGKAAAKQDSKWNALIEALGTGKLGSASIKSDNKGGESVTLKASENIGSMGDLTTPMSTQNTKTTNPFQDWFTKYFGA